MVDHPSDERATPERTARRDVTGAAVALTGGVAAPLRRSRGRAGSGARSERGSSWGLDVAEGVDALKPHPLEVGAPDAEDAAYALGGTVTDRGEGDGDAGSISGTDAQDGASPV
jgi:hypothetical protein